MKNKGKLDGIFAKQMLRRPLRFRSRKKEEANERTLCGHRGHFSARGCDLGFGDQNYPGGAVQGKASDSTDGAATSLRCPDGPILRGETFQAKPFSRCASGRSAWQEPYLRDHASARGPNSTLEKFPAPQH